MTAPDGATLSGPGDVGAELRKARVRASLFGTTPAPVKLERFTLLEQIGAGSMGEVFAAYDDRLDRKIAIKLVKRGSDAADQAHGRLLREAQTLARLSHPNVVQIYDADMHQGQVFIAMEFIRGRTMHEWLASADTLPRRARWRAILGHYVAAGRGLQAVHAAGLTHRDFKPRNVLVGDDGRVRVVDLGLARAATPDGDGDHGEPPQAPDALPESVLLTPCSAVIGTPAYMAPEVLAGQSADSRSDQFSFCVALYEALYGQRPYPGVTVAELRSAMVEGADSPAGRGAVRGRDVPAHVRKALWRGLAVDPAARFTDMGQLLAALEASPGRRRLWLAAVMAAVLGGLYVVTRPGAAPVCQGADRELAGVWNAARRSAIEAAMLGTGLPYAEEAWPLVAAGIARYAGDWKAMHRDACMAHREGRQSAILLDRRMACLERRRATLDSAIAVLAETTAASLQTSVDVVQSLPALGTCASVEALSAEVPPPEDARVAERVRALQALLARADVLEGAGRYQEARSLAGQVVAEAEALGYEPLLAAALLGSGRILLSMGQQSRQEAIAPLERAAQVSLRVRLDAVAVEAFARLVFARGTKNEDGAAVLAFAPMMEALSERLPERTFVHALLLNNIGVVHLARREPDQARAYFERAVMVQEARPSAQTIEVVNAAQNLAMVTADSDRRAELMDGVHRALEASLGASHPRTLGHRVHSSSFLADPRAAHDMLVPVCQTYRRYFPEAEDEIIRCVYMLGLLAAELGDTAQAAAHLSSLATPAPGSRHQVMLALARGYALYYRGEAEAALASFRAALAALPEEPDAWWLEKRVADALLGAAVSEQALGRHERAISALTRAMALFEKLTGIHYSVEYRNRLAWTQSALAVSLRAQARGAGKAGSAAQHRAEALLDQAEGWYRAHGESYTWRLQELERLRRDSGPGGGSDAR